MLACIERIGIKRLPEEKGYLKVVAKCHAGAVVFAAAAAVVLFVTVGGIRRKTELVHPGETRIPAHDRAPIEEDRLIPVWALVPIKIGAGSRLIGAEEKIVRIL